ncbi:putative exonuclease V [Rosa chinensis]|uniref:Putative exonuclease V n=1 Tax=Rosa chinensis TaxID=74649 RepID=A0A2P6QHP7_ROSCH|nr:exonuclease V, chloroplastic [Rosa chinensis]PRQ33706.1 putative exonuclease V [Rosa chinensis]
MTESPSDSRLLDHHHPHLVPQIPIEIVSDEEMALLFARSLIPSTVRAFPSSVRSLQYSITLLSKRSLWGCSQPGIEDSGWFNTTTQKKKAESLLHRFRNKKGLSASDFAESEWCEQQMRYILLNGNRVISKAMKTGRERHAKLEEEFVTKSKVVVNSDEDKWALRFLKFITGINQLYTEGLTRELPLVGFAEGIWMVGVIDEVQMPATETQRNPLLVDTKTRVKDKLPSEPQRRKGRLQLMFYKYLWDNLEASGFPADQFFDHFSLNPDCDLSEEIREVVRAKSGYPAKTLDDVVKYYRKSWILLPRAHDQLLLRYELQKHYSVIGEDIFAYDSDVFKKQLQVCLEFWLGKREASYTPEEERWKCYSCEFASTCPAAPAN